ncbi:MAG: helix-turn-helix transcriptional regulator [Lachnospiraceae bacterium]|nr:helix-turn-helix transcriptional regulator [Lachnospiraceae bacterium]
MKVHGLTKRETEITQLIIQGKSNAEIAGELFISETTVKKHVSNIFEKTGVGRREELIIRIRIE